MNIARFSIDSPVYTWIVMLTCLLGGIWGFATLGRLEDPAFTIKTAVVVTQYPGASAAEVAREVTEPLESAIQQMGEVDRISSVNQPGSSIINVDIESTHGAEELPEIWTSLRAKVANAARGLPEGAGEPLVNDGFGDVFGLYYAVTAEGFSDRERHELATFLRREILTVDGVADVVTDGLPEEAIFVEPILPVSFNQNIPPAAFQSAIATSDSVAEAGSRTDGGQRMIMQIPEGSNSISAISGLALGIGGEVVNLENFATVDRERVEHPDAIIRHNGVEAFTLGVAGLATENIVDVGHRVDAKLAELAGDLPVGVDLLPIYQQHVVVEQASNDFLVNLAMSVAIVVGVLALFMGWRAAVVVGATLLLTVVGTLFFMALFAIEMERISLGALIIAMGMLVDNAIVVAEGMQIAMHQGKSSREAATEAASKTQIPLLGATVIGIMAFAGIGLSPDATGEFLFSLFAVIGISLLLSWGLALTATPLLGHYVFKQGKAGGQDAYSGAIFRAYGTLLRICLRLWWLVIPALIAITAACYIGFAGIKQQFFPDSNTPLFFVHYKLEQGATVEKTAADLAILETWLTARDDVVAVTSFAGQGATRFMLTYAAEDANPSYGHLIVRTLSTDSIAPLQAELEDFAARATPEGEFRTLRLAFGPGGGNPIEVRFAGPDPAVLRLLAQSAIETLEEASPNIIDPRHDWRERELVLRPVYSDERAQTAGVSRDDIANSLLLATDGVRAGTLREDDRLIPIMVRLPRDSGLILSDLLVYSDAAGGFVPMEQVLDGFAFEAQNTLIHRRDRLPTITVGADIPRERTAAQVQAEVQQAVEAMEIPFGYRMEWGGEYEASGEAQESLAAQLPFSLIVMVVISILLFNALRQPLIIWLLVPMSVNGVALGLLGTGMPFTFTALLGLLSLSGMLIKNGIVLVDEIDNVRDKGSALVDAIVEASKSRLRPVVLAAATTILGMAPLLTDAFFVSMAITIMGGLAFASVLTLVAAPVLYYVFFLRSEPRPAAA